MSAKVEHNQFTLVLVVWFLQHEHQLATRELMAGHVCLDPEECMSDHCHHYAKAYT